MIMLGNVLWVTQKTTGLIRFTHTHTHTHTHLMALFRDYPGEPVPERLNQSGFHWSKRQWEAVASAGLLGHMQVCTSLQTDNRPASHHSVFYRPDALPAAQPTASKHWRQIRFTLTIMYHPLICGDGPFVEVILGWHNADSAIMTWHVYEQGIQISKLYSCAGYTRYTAVVHLCVYAVAQLCTMLCSVLLSMNTTGSQRY